MLLGTAQIGVRHPTAHWRQLLTIAAEVGIVGFDTAPLYSDGLAEDLVGELVRTRPLMRVQTKVGLERRLRYRRLPRPLAVAAAAGLSATGRREETRQLCSPGDIEAQWQGSAGRLYEVSVDTLLLHELPPALVTDDLVGYLRAVRESGRVRRLGVGGRAEQVTTILDRWPDTFELVQVPADDVVEILNSALAPGVLVQVHGLVRRAEVREAQDVPVAALSRLVESVAGTAHAVQPVVSTTSVERVVGWGRAWQEFGEDLAGSRQL